MQLWYTTVIAFDITWYAFKAFIRGTVHTSSIILGNCQKNSGGIQMRSFRKDVTDILPETLFQHIQFYDTFEDASVP
jgi:hypothetical protein